MSSNPLADAVRLAQAGRFAEASRICDEVLRQQPTHAPALQLAGVLALRSGDIATALRRLGAAAAIDARNAAAHANLGDALSAAGRLAEAIAAYRRAVEIDPRLAPAQAGLGHALHAHGDTAGAVAALERAVALDRQSPAFLTNLGAVLHAASRNDDALAALQRAHELAPRHAEPLYNIGVVLQARGDLAGAERRYRDALALAPQHVQALHNLGYVLAQQGQSGAALPLYERALSLAPDFAEAAFNRANALKDLGRFDDAIAGYDRVLARDPTHRAAGESRGLARLTRGDFAEGWRDYLARAVPRDRIAHPAGPLPADLSGKTIFLHCEQGLGDELFFLRFVPELARRGANIVSEADPRLLSIVRRHPGLSAAVARGDAPGPHDLALFQGDLPFLLGTTGAIGPATIAPDLERLALWRQRLAEAGPAPYVAVTWRAGVMKDGRFTKIAAPGEIGDALKGAPGTIVIVQRAPQPDEMATFRAALGRPGADFSRVNDDLEDMLALMALVDEYVAVSNTNVHLRAAAGRVSRVLVPFPPEWRWLARGDESSWFPGTRLYRQDVTGDWAPALERLAGALAS